MIAIVFAAALAVVHPLPSTPGAIDAHVTQANIRQTICVKGYTKTVRPPVSYTAPLKLKLMKVYGDTGSPSGFELDHLVSLELGGAPRDVRNLWPEPWAGPLGAHAKDRVENVAHAAVCAGRLMLVSAQQQIRTDWVRLGKSLGVL